MSVVSCPKCGGTNIFYIAEKGEYKCLTIGCGYKWRKAIDFVSSFATAMEYEERGYQIKEVKKDGKTWYLIYPPKSEELPPRRTGLATGRAGERRGGERHGQEPVYLTKNRAKSLYALIMANHICIGYYGPGGKEARAECVSREAKRIYAEVSEKMDKFAEEDPEGFRKWLVSLERGWGIK